ncbi:hypothetical protein CL653_00195, partial [bacterium]|nr:hypothetical protein [bacterium]
MSYLINTGLDPQGRIRRFNEFPWWAQQLIIRPWIRNRVLPGILPATTGIFGLMAAVAPLALIPAGLAALGSIAYFSKYLETIRENESGEPQFGQLEVFGLRTPVTFDEGFVMNLPGGRVLLRSKERFNEDIEVKRTRCRLNPHKPTSQDVSLYHAVSQALRAQAPQDIKSGGEIDLSIGLTLERIWRDGWEVLDYDDSGETKGVLDIIKDDVEEDLREVGRHLTWLQATFSTDLMSAFLISRLTGVTAYKGQNLFDNPTQDFIKNFLVDVQ